MLSLRLDARAKRYTSGTAGLRFCRRNEAVAPSIFILFILLINSFIRAWKYWLFQMERSPSFAKKRSHIGHDNTFSRITRELYFVSAVTHATAGTSEPRAGLDKRRERYTYTLWQRL